MLLACFRNSYMGRNDFLLPFEAYSSAGFIGSVALPKSTKTCLLGRGLVLCAFDILGVKRCFVAAVHL